MIKVAIVEDEESVYLKHKSYIDKYSEETGEIFEIFWMKDGDEIASDYKPEYDIIFLDIQLSRMDGMKTAEYIRKLDKDVILIFITNMVNYAIRGYAVNALDFLLKPVPYFAFSQQLKKSIERLRNKKFSYLLVQTEMGTVRVNTSDILFVESERHKITVFTKDEEYTFLSSMKEMEKKLEETKVFFRCNNGYLVNLAWVQGISDNCAIVGNHNLQISRPKKKQFMEVLTEYIGGVAK